MAECLLRRLRRKRIHAETPGADKGYHNSVSSTM